MTDVVFIGDPHLAARFRRAGIRTYAPPAGHLAERVMAEKRRCRVLAMTERTFGALPEALARELREASSPRLELLPDGHDGGVPISLILRRPSPRMAARLA